MSQKSLIMEDSCDVTFKSLGLSDQLVEACHALGWKAPTKIQVESIPQALQGNDIIGIAQTGSGKTAAFALPILESLLSSPQPFIACIISPTRELAFQISEKFDALGSSIGVRCAVIVGGEDMMMQAIAIARRPHILVATPGRLLDHLNGTKGFALCSLKYLVLDEADRILNMELEKEVNEILKFMPPERKTYLFSATMTQKVRKLKRACLKIPVKVMASSNYSTVDTLEQYFCLVPSKLKDSYLLYILREMPKKSLMIFAQTCGGARLLALTLQNLELRAIPVTGQMSQEKRLVALSKFKGGECDILVCTDVASRGLDFPSVDLVVNYDIPINPKDYIHRVGRTARAGRHGVAISLVNQFEVTWLLQIENLLGKKIPKYGCLEQDVLLLQEEVAEAKRISVLKIRSSANKRKKEQG